MGVLFVFYFFLAYLAFEILAPKDVRPKSRLLSCLVIFLAPGVFFGMVTYIDYRAFRPMCDRLFLQKYETVGKNSGSVLSVSAFNYPWVEDNFDKVYYGKKSRRQSFEKVDRAQAECPTIQDRLDFTQSFAIGRGCRHYRNIDESEIDAQWRLEVKRVEIERTTWTHVSHWTATLSSYPEEKVQSEWEEFILSRSKNTNWWLISFADKGYGDCSSGGLTASQWVQSVLSKE